MNRNINCQAQKAEYNNNFIKKSSEPRYVNQTYADFMLGMNRDMTETEVCYLDEIDLFIQKKLESKMADNLREKEFIEDLTKKYFPHLETTCRPKNAFGTQIPIRIDRRENSIEYKYDENRVEKEVKSADNKCIENRAEKELKSIDEKYVENLVSDCDNRKKSKSVGKLTARRKMALFMEFLNNYLRNKLANLSNIVDNYSCVSTTNI